MSCHQVSPLRALRQVLAISGWHCTMSLAGGLNNVNTLLQNILNVLQGISAGVVTIAILWVGYKMVFQNARWSAVANIVSGALFIGGASAIGLRVSGWKCFWGGAPFFLRSRC